MLNKITLVGAALAMSAGALVPTTAEAQHYRGDSYSRHYDGYGRDNYRGYDRRDRYDRYDRYERRANYRDYRRGNRCDPGNGGTVIGAIAGGLAGHEIAGRGDRTVGALIGGAVGALAGRAIDKSGNPRYCR